MYPDTDLPPIALDAMSGWTHPRACRRCPGMREGLPRNGRGSRTWPSDSSGHRAGTSVRASGAAEEPEAHLTAHQLAGVAAAGSLGLGPQPRWRLRWWDDLCDAAGAGSRGRSPETCWRTCSWRREDSSSLSSADEDTVGRAWWTRPWPGLPRTCPRGLRARGICHVMGREGPDRHQRPLSWQPSGSARLESRVKEEHRMSEPTTTSRATEAHLDLLQREEAPVWSQVTLHSTRGDFAGLILPRSETADALHIVLKLDTGYNIGVRVRHRGTHHHPRAQGGQLPDPRKGISLRPGEAQGEALRHRRHHRQPPRLPHRRGDPGLHAGRAVRIGARAGGHLQPRDREAVRRVQREHGSQRIHDARDAYR